MYREAYDKTAGDYLPLSHRLSIVVGFGKAAYTLFNVPQHDGSKSLEVARRLEHTPIPLQPELTETSIKIQNVLVSSSDPSLPRKKLGKVDLIGLTGVLMQFSSYYSNLRPYSMIPSQSIDNLYGDLVEAGKQGTPLDFSEQLEIALRQTTGDLPEALWRLFITTRLYSRWYDTAIIEGLEDYTQDEIVDRMIALSTSLRACKEFSNDYAQDAAGDAYYCWTHALAKVAFGALPEKIGKFEMLGGEVTANGTSLMHGLAHRLKKQNLPSDHTIAAGYGNMIGDICTTHLDQYA